MISLLYLVRSLRASHLAKAKNLSSKALAPSLPSSVVCSSPTLENAAIVPVPSKSLVLGTDDDFLEPDFRAACAVASRLSSLDTFQKLRVYAYFKQATCGACNVPRPSMLDIPGCAKWDAWKALGDLSTSSAKEYYIHLINDLSQGAEDHATSSSSKGAGGDGFSMGPAMSRMADEEEEEIAEADKDIFIYASEDNKEAVTHLLEQKVDVNCQNEDGLTPLHWAVDRGNKEIAEYLLLQKADINAKDSDEATPLHYAVDCDHLELVDLLLRAGADPTATNAVGEIPAAAASPEVQALFSQRT